MTLKKFIILGVLTLSASFAVGQKKGVINIDSSGLPDGYHSQKLSEGKRQTAFTGAEDFIKSIIGEKLLPNIWLASGETRGPGVFSLYGLPKDTCFELRYYAIDKTDTIGYIRLLVDRNGMPMKSFHCSNLFNRIELIAGIKRHFDNKFNFSYAQAAALGKQKGLWINPHLRCEIENELISTDNSNIFIKVRYYWSFFHDQEGTILEVNAETGKIEKERNIPKMLE